MIISQFMTQEHRDCDTEFAQAEEAVANSQEVWHIIHAWQLYRLTQKTGEKFEMPK